MRHRQIEAHFGHESTKLRQIPDAMSDDDKKLFAGFDRFDDFISLQSRLLTQEPEWDTVNAITIIVSRLTSV